ncbi:MAG: hypothetical protein QNJ37_06435 [Crocosphaera sp.]|nr:hypothetical protein [Crocosphaera sp.]
MKIKKFEDVKVSEISVIIKKLQLSPEQKVNLTIEEKEDKSDSLLSIMDKVGRKAQNKGLTEDKLEELLADES